MASTAWRDPVRQQRWYHVELLALPRIFPSECSSGAYLSSCSLLFVLAMIFQPESPRSSSMANTTKQPKLWLLFQGSQKATRMYCRPSKGSKLILLAAKRRPSESSFCIWLLLAPPPFTALYPRWSCLSNRCKKAHL